MGTTVERPGWRDVGRAFLALGLTSVGGPVAHLGYFHREFVERRGWIAPDAFAEIVAVSQALPGPSSSQAGLAIGWRLAGVLGGGWLGGLKAAAGAIVLVAVVQMARQTAPDMQRVLVVIVAAFAALGYGAAGQLWILSVALVMGAVVPPVSIATARPEVAGAVSRGDLLLGAGLIIAAIGGLALAVMAPPSPPASAYGAGALVFGGGHAVLPLLEGEFVGRGWVEREAFLAGYGAAQALPGPLFAFGAYLGATQGGLGMGLLTLLAIFLPGALLILGLEPLWPRLRRWARLRGALALAGAVATGLLLAAFLNTVAPEALSTPATSLIALGALLMLTVFKLPTPLVVAVAALAGLVTG